MNFLYPQRKIHKTKFLTAFTAALLFFFSAEVKAQYSTIPPFSTTTVPAGSYYIDMGITPQTVANGLKPYGLLYALLATKIPIIWSIEPTKGKDGIDIPSVPTSSGTKVLKGGPFIILKQHITPAVTSIITTWAAKGVIGYYSTAPVSNVPVFVSTLNQPKWTLDLQNGSMALPFFVAAEIPEAAYGFNNKSGWKLPGNLDCCDDVFVLPHADPKWWATYVAGNQGASVIGQGNLYNWNLTCKGAIWVGCHAGSALNNMYNPFDINQQTNFLTTKTLSPGPNIIVPVSGSTNYSQNSLLLWGNHADGAAPYLSNTGSPSPSGTIAPPGDPVSQFMGKPDPATQSGSEQIYIPVKGQSWLPSSKIITWDPDQSDVVAGLKTQGPAVAIAYGPGFGDPLRGNVMMEAGHNISGTAPANIAAIRAFFNFSYLSAYLKSVVPAITGLPATINSGDNYNLSITLPVGANSANYTVVWSSSCGGTFTPGGGFGEASFVPPVSNTPTACLITATMTDNCGRVTFDTKSTTVQCGVSVTPSVTNPCFNTPNGGVISFTSASAGPYSYSWTRTGGGSGSGSGNTITGLSAGSYSVTVTVGSGCSKVFSSTLTQSPQIIPTATPVAVQCFGGTTGAINVSVSGGIPGFTYLWNNGTTTQNRSGLTAGTYNLTVTDSKGCIGTTSATVTQPALLQAAAVPTPINCFGENTGSITVTVSGGTGTNFYLWNDGTATQNRTNLAAGSYSVTVADANACKATASATVTQPASGIALSTTQVNESCFGQTIGSADLSVSGGSPAYTYAWSNGATTQDISGLAAGNYRVTVTDSKLCIANLTVTITQPAALVLSAVITHPFCPPNAPQNTNNGNIDLTVTGGTGPYSYTWTKDNNPYGSGTQDLSTLTAGSYKVVVTDANGCTINATYVLTNTSTVPVPITIINH